MKDKFLLPSVLMGLLQAVLLFLCMDIFYWQTFADRSALLDFLDNASPLLIPGTIGFLFGGVYAVPMLFFTKKRNWLWYYLCSVGFFLLFTVFFLAAVYALPEQVAHIDLDLGELGELVPGNWEGLIFGLLLMVLSLPYFLFAGLAKLTAHLVFIGFWLVRLIRKRRAASL